MKLLCFGVCVLGGEGGGGGSQGRTADGRRCMNAYGFGKK